ncbi:GntR family transcriptional regulator [Reyranella sp.]|uniref:GntR family transcriptional regulator n=1 Tax=Reyranella sp. TaxID=1929291 RepID=UPI003D0B93A3
MAGELRTGQFVSQRELADLLGATLNPVREAIRKLEAEGLINVYAQRGIQIVEGSATAEPPARDRSDHDQLQHAAGRVP